MRFFLLTEGRPNTDDYASFAHLGTWTESELCPKCGRHSSRLIEPMLVEFEPYSNVLADFMWCSYTFIVLPPVRGFFELKKFPCCFKRVEIVRPEGLPQKNRVLFPYTGPQLTWVQAAQSVAVDVAASGLALSTCPVCRRTNVEFRQIDLVIDKAEWHGEKMFKISQFSPSIAYVTEEALDELLLQHFTNLGYIEAGKIR